MSLLGQLGTWLKSVVRPSRNHREALVSFMQQGTSIGLYTNVWTESRFEQVRHFKHWVYIAVDRIATDIAMHAPNVSLVRDPSTSRPGREERYLPASLRQKALTPLLSHQELEPVRNDHPLLRLLSDPNEPDTAYDLWYETILYLLLTGNSYWWMPKGDLGLPAAIWVLPSHWVWANIGRKKLIDTYEIRPVEGNYVRLSIPADEIIHFKRKSPVSKVDGYSPLSAGSQWIDTQESIDRTRWFSFRNGLFPGVALEFDEKLKVPDTNVLDRIEAKIMARYAGEIRANKPLFVPPGVKVRQLQITPREMDFTQSAEQIRDQILALFGVGSVIAHANKGMTYGSLRAEWAAYYMNTLNPIYRFLGQCITEKLARRYDESLKVWWEDRTPMDPELLEESLKTDFLLGAITPNEVRNVRGRSPYPHGGDDPLVQGALMSLPYVSGGQIVSINSSNDSATSPKKDRDEIPDKD